jgi:hypothetical protein
MGDGFDHPHDSEISFAFLRVTRKNEETKDLDKPMMFKGVTAITGPRSQYNYFENISYRICQRHGVNPLSEIIGIPSKKKGDHFAYYAAMNASLIEPGTRKIRKRSDSHEYSDPKLRDAKDASHLIDGAVLIGYLWTKAETEIGVKPLAISALRAKAGASSGGAKSGESRKQKRAKTWEPIAKEMALKLRAEKPSASQDDVATDTAHEWKDANVKAPGHTTLKALISKMEKAGELPKRRRI